MTNQQQISIISSNSDLRPKQLSIHTLFLYLGVPLVVNIILNLTTGNSISLLQVGLAFLLLLIPWVSFQHWLTKENSRLPLFALIAGFHWIYFVVALFWGDRRAPVWYSNNVFVSENAITTTLVMVLIGMIALGLGMRTHLKKSAVSPIQQSPELNTQSWSYIRLLLIAGLVSSLFPSAVYILGESGRQWITALQTTVPLLAFLALLIKYFQGKATQIDKLLICGYIILSATTGLASGWSGPLFYLGVAIGLVYLLERRKIPIRALLIVILISLFLQPAKSSFRQEYWYSEDTQSTLLDRVGYWLNGSLISWQAAFSDSSGEQLINYLRGSMLRVSLLTHAANVHDNTPTIIPYQSGQLYAFSIAGLIPRFLWSDKPSGNDANRFYQVTYNVTQEDRLDNVSIAIGYVTEAYISFGWVGVFAIMYLLGIFMGTINRFFFVDARNMMRTSIGIVAVIALFRVETQLGLYLVSAIQAIVVSYIVFFPIIFLKNVP